MRLSADESTRKLRIVNVLRWCFFALLAITILNMLAALFDYNVYLPFSLCSPVELFMLSADIPDNQPQSVSLMLVATLILFVFIWLYYYSRSHWQAILVAAVLYIVDFICVASFEILFYGNHDIGLKIVSFIACIFVLTMLMIYQIYLRR